MTKFPVNISSSITHAIIYYNLVKCIGLKAVENADSWVAFDERKDLCDVQDFGVKFKFGPDSMKIKKSNSFNKGLS